MGCCPMSSKRDEIQVITCHHDYVWTSRRLPHLILKIETPFHTIRACQLGTFVRSKRGSYLLDQSYKICKYHMVRNVKVLIVIRVIKLHTDSDSDERPSDTTSDYNDGNDCITLIY